MPPRAQQPSQQSRSGSLGQSQWKAPPLVSHRYPASQYCWQNMQSLNPHSRYGVGVCGTGVGGAWHRVWHVLRSTPPSAVTHVSPAHLYNDTGGAGDGVAGRHILSHVARSVPDAFCATATHCCATHLYNGGAGPGSGAGVEHIPPHSVTHAARSCWENGGEAGQLSLTQTGSDPPGHSAPRADGKAGRRHSASTALRRGGAGIMRGGRARLAATDTFQ